MALKEQAYGIRERMWCNRPDVLFQICFHGQGKRVQECFYIIKN